MSGRTLEDRVLDHIEEHRGEWRVRWRGGGLRRKSPMSVEFWWCPLESLFGGGALPWHLPEFRRLEHAADGSGNHDPALRARMLEKAGLTEVSGE